VQLCNHMSGGLIFYSLGACKKNLLLLTGEDLAFPCAFLLGLQFLIGQRRNVVQLCTTFKGIHLYSPWGM